jgi:hypothetical protein
MDQDQFIQNRLHSALKTLCILSYIMCGVWFIVGFLTLFASMVINEEMIAEMNKIDKVQAEMVRVFMPIMKPWALLLLAFTSISLVGVRIMQKLKLNGLYIYMIGELGMLAVGMFLKPDMPNESMTMGKQIYQTIITIAIDSIFIFQYRNILKAILKRESNT